MKNRTLIASDRGIASIIKLNIYSGNEIKHCYNLTLFDEKMRPVKFQDYAYKQSALRYAFKYLS